MIERYVFVYENYLTVMDVLLDDDLFAVDNVDAL
jgi:hypothetical protein